MYIHLNTEDMDVVNRVFDLVCEKSDDVIILQTGIRTDPDYVPGSGISVVSYGKAEWTNNRAVYRWRQLQLSALGARLWTEQGDETLSSPIYRGIIPEDLNEIIVDAAYAENKAAYFASFGVNYLGRTAYDPRIVVLMDNTKDRLSLTNSDLYNLLLSLPESIKSEMSWESIGFVSAGNVNKLEGFLDYLSETNVVAYSTGAFGKLRYLGRDYANVGTPRPEQDYGVQLRDAASRLRPSL